MSTLRSAAADLDRLRSLLEDLEGHWRRVGAPIADRLAPGLSAREVQQTVQALQLRLPDEAVVWYGWHNGIQPQPSGNGSERLLGPGRELLSLQQAVDRYHWLRDVARQVGDGAAEWWWPTTWFPIVRTSGRRVLAVDCAIGERRPTPVRAVDWEDEDFHQPRVPSLADAVAVWVELLERGFWLYRPELGDGGLWDQSDEVPDLRLRMTSL